MANGLTFAGLLTDLCGAVILASAVAFERPSTYMRGEGTKTWDYNAPADLRRAAESALALAGLALLATGFASQGVAAAGVAVEPEGLAPYPVTLAAVALAYVGSQVERRRRERAVIRARLLEDPRYLTAENRKHIWPAYARAAAKRSTGPRPGETIRAWAERRYGRAYWRNLPEPPPDDVLVEARTV